MNTGSIKIRQETEHEVELDWKIKDFLTHLKSTIILTSPSFIWSSVNWHLQMTYNSEYEILLYLYKNTSEIQVSVIYEFGILVLDGTTEKRIKIVKRNFPSYTGLEIIHKSELEKRKRELLSVGYLTFSCTITHLDSLAKPENVKYAGFEELSSNLESLYGCDKTSDLTIVVGEQKYPVHKTILAARSHVFAAMLQHDMEEAKTGIINVADCDPTSFKDFLLYLYTGMVENFSSENVCHLYKIADKYNVEQLKDFCVRYMKRNLSVENWFDIVILANQFEITDLIFVSQEFFNRNAKKIIKEDDWEQFIKQHFPTANQFLMNILDKVKNED